MSLEDEKKLGVRENRYGLHGDNGYNDIVREQRKKEGLATLSAQSANRQENILNFTQKESSPSKSDQKSEVDLKPVKEEKRKIVNQALGSGSVTTKASKVPGILNVKDEATRQKNEVQKRDANAATVIQKWARGW